MTELHSFSVGYHKAIKKILGMSYREGNHFACYCAGLFTLENLLNKGRIGFLKRVFDRQCPHIDEHFAVLRRSSFVKSTEKLLEKKYKN